jgi:hypothetical protein
MENSQEEKKVEVVKSTTVSGWRSAVRGREGGG